MEYFFKVLFGKASAMGISAILVFSTPHLYKHNDKILIEGNLKGILTQKVRRKIQTGTPVSIEYDISLIAYQNNKEKLFSQKLVHTIQYIPLEGVYKIGTGKKFFSVKKINEAGRLAGVYRVEMNYIKSQHNRYDLYVEAKISYASTLDINMQTNALWEYYIPNKKMKNILLEVRE